MKRTTSVLFFLVLMLFVASCTKEIEELSRDFEDQAEKIAATDQVDTSAKEDVYYSAVINARLDDTLKTTLNGLNIDWCSGDSIAIMQYGRYKRHDNPEAAKGYDELYARDATYNKFVCANNGHQVAFTGTIKNFTFRDTSADIEPDGADGNSQGNVLYSVYPYVNSGFTRSTSIFYHTVPSVQSGLLSDFGKYAMTYARVGETKITEDEGKLSFDLTFKTPLPITKLTIPSDLNDVDTIFVSASKYVEGVLTAVPLAGKLKFRLSGGGSSIDVSYTSNTITIARGGEAITGDVYFFVLPDKRITTDKYCSTATRMCFDFKRKTGSVARFQGKIVDTTSSTTITNTQLFCGRLKSLGTVKPAKLNFSTVVGCTAPTSNKSLSMSVTDGIAYSTDSLKGCTFTKLASEDEISDYTYGVEFSADGGSKWTRATSTNGVAVAETDNVSFSVKVPGIPLNQDVKLRTFAYKTEDASTEGHSVSSFVNPKAGDRFILLSPTSPTIFTEKMQSSATEEYNNKAFYLSGSFYPLYANGTLYISSSYGFILNQNRSLSLPVIPGANVTTVFIKIGNKSKYCGLLKDVNHTAPHNDHSLFNYVRSTNTDYKRYFRLDVPSTYQREYNVMGSSVASTSSTYASSVLVCYTKTPAYGGKISSVNLDYLNGKTRCRYQLEDGDHSKFTKTLEYYDGTSWQTPATTSQSYSDGTMCVTADNPAQFTKFRLNVVGTGVDAKYSHYIECPKPDKQIVIDFTGTNPFEPDGTEESGSGTVDDPYLGKSFSFGESFTSKGNYTSYKLTGTDYKFVFGKDSYAITHAYGWIFHPVVDGVAKPWLKTAKIRIKIPTIGEGYVLKSAYASAGEGYYSKRNFQFRRNTIESASSANKLMTEYGIYWTFTTTTASDWFCYLSVSTDERTALIILNYNQETTE